MKKYTQLCQEFNYTIKKTGHPKPKLPVIFSITFILSGGSPWPVVAHTKTTRDSEIMLACLMRGNTHEGTALSCDSCRLLKKQTQMGRGVKAVTHQCRELKLNYSWSGTVRINGKSHHNALSLLYLIRQHSPRCKYPEVTPEPAAAFSSPAAQSSGPCPGPYQSGSHTGCAGWASTLWLRETRSQSVLLF